MERPRPGKHSTAIVVVIVVLLPALYVLSMGPAIWLYVHGFTTNKPFEAYAPLIWAMDHSAVFDAAFGRYLDLWNPKEQIRFLSG